MNERLQEMSRCVEQGDHFPIRLRGGVGNSTLTTILTDLQTNHTLGDGKSIGAISRFIECFEPIGDPSSNHLESLWDQTATAVMAYRHLPQEDQEQINGMVDTLLWSLAHTPQERNVGGHVKDISTHVRDLATTIGLETDTWEHITEPKHSTKQKQLHMSPKLTTASALAAVALVAACTPARPTITPEVTIPAITHSAPALTMEIPPTQIMGATVTKTPSPHEVNELLPESSYINNTNSFHEWAYGEYTPEQISLIDSGYFSAELNKLVDFINDYWCKATNDPFYTPKNEAGIHWPDFKMMFIFNRQSTVGHVVFKAAVKEDSVFYFPIVDGKFLETPPEIDPRENFNFDIPEDYGPLWMPLVMDQSAAENASTDSSGNIDYEKSSVLVNSILGVDDNGDLVRLKNGQIVARLDLTKGAWTLSESK